MKQAVIKKGIVIPIDVPKVQGQSGFVLIKVYNSCVSAGTEMKAVNNSGKSLIRRAIENPDLVKKAKDIIKDRGLRTFNSMLKTYTEFGLPIGYSLSGVVVSVGEGITDLKVGDRVAAAGAGYADHAEYVNVPRNLVVKIPDEVSFEYASTVTLGSIALQGVRRTELRLGEIAVVMGLGILGQLTTQLLLSAGCTVIGLDIDKKRMELALKNGVKYVLDSTAPNVVEEVNRITGGYGADAVLFTAATQSNEPLSMCFKMCRRKGKVILVGSSGMEIRREDIYTKEIDFLISTSYGPGRYDRSYEEEGKDYPYAYVRWTENRNMSEYLEQIARKRIDLDNLISGVYPIEKVQEAYESYQGSEKPLIILLSYNVEENYDSHQNGDLTIYKPSSNITNKGNIIRYAVIGAGSFAKSVHIPNLQKMKDKFKLHAVMSRTGVSASSLAQQYGAEYATTDYDRVLEDKSVDLVMICTRHHLHADYAIRALKAGKAVFVEKPPALNKTELDALLQTIRKTGFPYFVGYNRRFSSYAVEIKNKLKDRVGPVIINYQMNAGYYPADHWVHGPEGGGRIIGEGCHIIDLFSYLIGAKCESISVNSIKVHSDYYSYKDNVVATMKYSDGSIATLSYYSLGNREYPKELMTVAFDGKLITLNDYVKLEGFGVKTKKIESKSPDKGQFEELIHLYEALTSADNHYPISLDEIEETSLITFAIDDEATAAQVDADQMDEVGTCVE
jgi:predicted dehydrogenase/threonine dehydrogenase-like Zn-dependent dehydrogenase